jgi:hypothetical protein
VIFTDPWPEDPRLDPFRDTVWELSREGRVAGYVLTAVDRMRSFPAFWMKRERLLYQVHWLDGRRDVLQEDYGPGWYAVAELEQCYFDPASDGQLFEARRVEDPERSRIWAQYGAPA